jgi:hypothetical protein
MANSRKDRKALNDRLNQISEGLTAEAAAIQAAIRGGKVITIPNRAGSLMSGKVVDSVRYGADGLWVTMKNYGGSFTLGNDERWGEIVRLAGLERDPRALSAFAR